MSNHNSNELVGEILDEARSQIANTAKACTDSLNTLQALHAELNTDLDKQRYIYYAVAEKIRKTLAKLKEECQAPLESLRSSAPNTPSATFASTSVVRISNTSSAPATPQIPSKLSSGYLSVSHSKQGAQKSLASSYSAGQLSRRGSAKEATAEELLELLGPEENADFSSDEDVQQLLTTQVLSDDDDASDSTVNDDLDSWLSGGAILGASVPEKKPEEARKTFDKTSPSPSGQGIRRHTSRLKKSSTLESPSKSAQIRRNVEITPGSEKKTTHFPSLLLPGDYPSLLIHQSSTGLLPTNPQLDWREDEYTAYFLEKEHTCFVIADTETENSVLAVLHSPQEPNGLVHRALRTTKKGSSSLTITLSSSSSSSDSLQDRLLNAVSSLFSGKTVTVPAKQNEFSRSFATVEQKHSQRRPGIKLGIIYSKPGQVYPKDMFTNGQDGTPCSDSFWTFMNLLGQEIELSSWKGYRGDMGTEGKTFYDKWHEREISVIYHVAPLLNAEGHRRLIGNDVGVIFFLDAGESIQFDPMHVHLLGTVPQIFAVVQPVGDRYRMAVFTNINIKFFEPEVPDCLLTPDQLKNLLLTKMYNGLVMTTYCPPLNRLFFVPRSHTIEDIIEKFPPPEKKTSSRKSSKRDVSSSSSSSSFSSSPSSSSSSASSSPSSSLSTSRGRISHIRDILDKAPPSFDGDEQVVIKGTALLMDPSAPSKAALPSRKRCWVTIRPESISLFDSKTKTLIFNYPFSTLVRYGAKDKVGMIFEFHPPGKGRQLLLFTASSSSDLSRLASTLQQVLTKLENKKK